jgi:hypothetical protein
LDASVVDGPVWCEPGLLERAGRYPLAVEAPVMAGVDALVPGVSTVTRYARYYGLYWALAAHDGRHGLDRTACQQLVRRAEVGLAVISKRHDNPEGRMGLAHGVDRLTHVDGGLDSDVWLASRTGKGSYSPRDWGFWSQYNGPSATLGTVLVDDGALRPGRQACPAPVETVFAPLIEATNIDHATPAQLESLDTLRLQHDLPPPDMAPLAELLAACRNGHHEPDDWIRNDVTRRATLRILARAWQLFPDAETWTGAFANAVAYGDVAAQDPILAAEPRTMAWRGVVLRHHSVGAWRRLWAQLVDQVYSSDLPVTRQDLHDWISDRLPEQSVTAFDMNLPAPVDDRGDPVSAEDEVVARFEPVVAELGILLLGARRLDSLSGIARKTFLGQRPTYLDPRWVQRLRMEYEARPVRDLGRRLVDDMLAQARRVAMRKLRLRPDGTMAVFSRLHERNGWYLASSSEGRGNVGLRLGQLADLAVQTGLFTLDPQQPITSFGHEALDMPQ